MPTSEQGAQNRYILNKLTKYMHPKVKDVLHENYPDIEV
ncbi:MAG: hypothetical protein ACJAWL_002967 [Motiliproteus sp.]|jgi:hypothetical protein